LVRSAGPAHQAVTALAGLADVVVGLRVAGVHHPGVGGQGGEGDQPTDGGAGNWEDWDWVNRSRGR